MKVEIIIIKHYAPEYERRTIEAVARTTEHLPEVSLTAHFNPPGVGLAVCWNRLISRSDAEMIVLLNSDTMPARGWLDRMLDTFASHDNVGAVVPSSNAMAGSEIPITFGAECVVVSVIDDFAISLHDQMARAVAELEVASATCLAFPREVWKSVGGFDEDFFLYGEDSEFTWRIRRSGRRLLWRRDAYVHHYKGRSVEAAVRRGELDYAKVRAEATRLWREKTGKDPKTGVQIIGNAEADNRQDRQVSP